MCAAYVSGVLKHELTGQSQVKEQAVVLAGHRTHQAQIRPIWNTYGAPTPGREALFYKGRHITAEHDNPIHLPIQDVCDPSNCVRQDGTLSEYTRSD
jgi:hypothetical protein